MNTASACPVCSENTHRASKCPELRADMKEGFYSGGVANRDYGGEEDHITRDHVSSQLQDMFAHKFLATQGGQAQDNGNPFR